MAGTDASDCQLTQCGTLWSESLVAKMMHRTMELLRFRSFERENDMKANRKPIDEPLSYRTPIGAPKLHKHFRKDSRTRAI